VDVCVCHRLLCCQDGTMVYPVSTFRMTVRTSRSNAQTMIDARRITRAASTFTMSIATGDALLGQDRPSHDRDSTAIRGQDTHWPDRKAALAAEAPFACPECPNNRCSKRMTVGYLTAKFMCYGAHANIPPVNRRARFQKREAYGTYASERRPLVVRDQSPLWPCCTRCGTEVRRSDMHRHGCYPAMAIAGDIGAKLRVDRVAIDYRARAQSPAHVPEVGPCLIGKTSVWPIADAFRIRIYM